MVQEVVNALDIIIIGCPSRVPTYNEYRPQVTAHFWACRIGDHLLKALELGIEVVVSDTKSHRGEHWRGNTEGSEIERKVATFFDDDTISEQVKDMFSSQVLLGWEDTFQGSIVRLFGIDDAIM